MVGHGGTSPLVLPENRRGRLQNQGDLVEACQLSFLSPQKTSECTEYATLHPKRTSDKNGKTSQFRCHSFLPDGSGPDDLLRSEGHFVKGIIKDQIKRAILL